MASNLRSKSLTGHVADASGNVIRNTSIIIKDTYGNIMDSTQTNDDGYFVTSPLPNGAYSIFDDGVLIATKEHTPDKISIECFVATDGNKGPVSNFWDLVNTNKINDFVSFIQIESDVVNTSRYGNIYPLYVAKLKGSNIQWQHSMAEFLGFSEETLITTTRFDVEYYSPISEGAAAYKRVRWSGVPGIRYATNGKIVLPLDYMSFVASLPKANFQNCTVTSVDLASGVVQVNGLSANIGDMVHLYESGVNFYGICTGNVGGLTLSKWDSDKGGFPSIQIMDVASADVFDGMFEGLSTIGESVNSYFTVSENTEAQNTPNESYEY